MKKISTILAFICAMISFAAGARTTQVAVVVDSVTYRQARSEVDAYLKAITLKDRKAVLIYDNIAVPDSLRATLRRMYEKDGLEGAVLIGDVPIPMIRDAQHLCSAFKMNQKMKWQRSSVPSDRFYDDFSLEFKFLRQDESRPELFYYSLSPDGAQKVSPAIYTSRIRPMQGENKYEYIKAYLKKAVDAKNNPNPLNRAMFFAGHGYNSESMFARMEEHHTLMKQLPSLDAPGGRLDFIDHSFDKAVKGRLLKALSDNELDLAILHHHGAPGAQYMNGSPYVSNPDGWLGLARNYFRGKMRDSKSPEVTKAGFIKNFGIPEKWLDEASDPQLTKQDSIYAASMDIVLDDLKAAQLGAKMVIFDACFNGAFINDDYVAANYLFGEGHNTLVARAHSVNTLQDKWENELVGLLSRGVCAGNWAKLNMDLDTHLFGDPTFCFGERSALDSNIGSVKAAKKYLKSDDPELRALAVKTLSSSGEMSRGQLLDIQKTDSERTVRLEAMLCAAEGGAEDLYEFLVLGLQDNYELTARLAGKYAGRNRDPRLMDTARKVLDNPLTTIRVAFQIRGFLGKTTDKEDVANLLSAEPNLKDALNYVRSERNACETDAVDPMLEAYSKTSDRELKLTIAETLGWYRFSYKKDEIRSACEGLLKNETDSRLADELRKSINRLK